MKIFTRKPKQQLPSLMMTVLPNMVFLLLFFFLIMTNVHSDSVKSAFRSHPSNTLDKLERKTLVTVIAIAPSMKSATGGNIQINDSYVPSPSDISAYLVREKSSLTEADQKNMQILLRIEKNTPMGVVFEVKQQIMRMGITNVLYD